MGIVVAGGSAKLGRKLARLQRGELFVETIDKHHDLLTQSRGRGRLPVGLGEHGHIAPLVGILLQLGDEFFQLRTEHLFKSLLDGEWHAGVVDVL